MALPQNIRYPVFCSVLLFAFVATFINAHLVSLQPTIIYVFPKLSKDYPGPIEVTRKIDKPSELSDDLGLSASILTLITIVTFLVFDCSGKANPTIAAEIGFLGALWILWTVTLGFAGRHTCDNGFLFPSLSLSCAETGSAFAFALLIWLILLAYIGTLITFSFIAKNKGNHGIWLSGVFQADFYRSGGYDRIGSSDEDSDSEFFASEKHDT